MKNWSDIQNAEQMENIHDAFIEIKNLCVSFDGVDVLKNINLEIKEGEINGIWKKHAGKSILMMYLEYRRFW